MSNLFNMYIILFKRVISTSTHNMHIFTNTYAKFIFMYVCVYIHVHSYVCTYVRICIHS